MVDWIAEAVAALDGPKGAFTWGQLESDRAATIAVSRCEILGCLVGRPNPAGVRKRCRTPAPRRR